MTRRGHTVSERVVRAVANETDIDLLELPPLFEAVDPDALDALARTISEGEITFQYVDCAVTVDSTGTVDLADHWIGGESTEASATSN